jgi:flagellar motor switch protein FliM
VLNRFETEGPENKSFIDVVYPYASLKPVRELLRSRVQAGDGNEESDKTWREDLNDALGDSTVEARALMGKVELSLDQLESMAPGDTFFFRKPDMATVLVNKVPAYHATVGVLGTQTAIQVRRALKPGQV